MKGIGVEVDRQETKTKIEKENQVKVIEKRWKQKVQ